MPPRAGVLRHLTVLCSLLAVAVPALARDRVLVVGSSTVFPFATAVAETFGRGGRFKTPVVESTGTGGGFKVFCAGVGLDTPDVTDASRPITDDERRACAKNGVTGIAAIRIGSDGILVANARSGPVLDLTREHLYRAVAKRVVVGDRLVANPYRRWREIDARLPDLPIRVLGPAPNHGTRDAFVALALVPVCERQPIVRALDSAERRDACQAVREDGPWVDVAADYGVLFTRLVADPGAVGVVTYSYLDQNRERIQAATIEGVAPTVDAIVSSRYPMTRSLFLYVKTAHVGAVPGLAEFVQEFLSDRAAGREGYLVERGLAPLPQPYLDFERRKAEALAPARR
jgi:phosphate transport system substrate-binding protein